MIDFCWITYWRFLFSSINWRKLLANWDMLFNVWETLLVSFWQNSLLMSLSSSFEAWNLESFWCHFWLCQNYVKRFSYVCLLSADSTVWKWEKQKTYTCTNKRRKSDSSVSSTTSYEQSIAIGSNLNQRQRINPNVLNQTAKDKYF